MNNKPKAAVYAVCPEMIFTGLNEQMLKGHAVVIEGNLIRDIVSFDSLPGDINKISPGNTTLLPGFIDTHVHLHDWMFPLYLAHGVTTVRDVGSNMEWILKKRSEAEKPDAACPSILCCGPLLDGKPCYHADMSWGIETAADMRTAIQRLGNKKVNAVKLYEGLDMEKVRCAVEEAGKYGLHVLGHFEEKVKLVDAVKAGVDEVEHLAGVPQCYSEDVIEQIDKNNVWTVPTQIVFEQVFDFVNNKYDMEHVKLYVPDIILYYWSCFRENITRKYCGYESLSHYCENHRKYLSALINNGARIAVGTDTPFQFSMPGFSYFGELSILSECGMSNADVLKCATVKGAELLKVKDTIGTIEEGKHADMVLVEGNPVENLRNLKNIKLVFKKGRIYEPQVLLKNARQDKNKGNEFETIR